MRFESHQWFTVTSINFRNILTLAFSFTTRCIAVNHWPPVMTLTNTIYFSFNETGRCRDTAYQCHRKVLAVLKGNSDSPHDILSLLIILMHNFEFLKRSCSPMLNLVSFSYNQQLCPPGSRERYQYI